MSTQEETVEEETVEITAPLTLADRLAFMKLPIEERRRILAEQAEAMIAEYDLEENRRVAISLNALPGE